MDGQDTEVQNTEAQLDFPIVGIGASAGGLEAVTAMFRNIDTGTGMAYVLVMHLDPDHESLMAELLSRQTNIPVRQIEDGEPVEVDCLHVIPPGYGLRIEKGVFRLDAFSEPRGLRRPIDSFFSSLAHVQNDKAACVILSGTGADGTAGLRVIKELGGVCAVQSPQEARYDGMPHSAISTRFTDFLLLADEIVPRIKAYFEGLSRIDFPDEKKSERFMLEIASILRDATGKDFSGYKRSTLFRRLHRRMKVLELSDLQSYLDYLTVNADEQNALADDFLINVTSFFRDRHNFEALRKLVLTPMISDSSNSDEIRIWVPGCSSGQEAYSLAMQLHMTCEEQGVRPMIQIFATDLDEGMINQARRAQYPASSFGELPKECQQAYTVGLDGKFEIVKGIREMVRFSCHNLIQDPPFSKIDLICCRNLIIYLGKELQQELFPLLHFSLKPKGHLFLGTSENVSRQGDLFSAVDERARIFRRKETAQRVRLNLPLGTPRRIQSRAAMPQKLSASVDFPIGKGLSPTNASIYDQYAPPFVRVTSEGQIIDSSGDLSLFLKSRPGEERDLHMLARDALRNVLSPLIADASLEKRPRAMKNVKITSPFGVQNTDVIAHPLKDDTVAVVFSVKDRLKPILDEFEVERVPHSRRIADLEEELQANRMVLKSKVEEIETANEELKSSNEEMMSMNEELQSANEELTTANEELKNKIDELTVAHADLDNFLQSADMAMVVLDDTMRIRHLTSAACKMLPMKYADRGRSITEFNIGLGDIEIAREIARVNETGNPYAISTKLDANGNAYSLRIIPYSFKEGKFVGTTITITDISDEVQLRQNLIVESARLNLAMQSGNMGFCDYDLAAGTVAIDAQAASQLGLAGAGKYTFADVTKNIHPDDAEAVKAARAEALNSGKDYHATYRVPDANGENRWFLVRGSIYQTANGQDRLVDISIDLTDEMKMRNDLSIESEKLRLAMKAGRMGLAELDVEKDELEIDAALADMFSLDGPGSVTMDELTRNFVNEDKDIFSKTIEAAITNDEEYECDVRVEEPDQPIRWIRNRGVPFVNMDGQKVVVGPSIDITETVDNIRRREVLIGEMSHRIKNLFAVINGIVQSLPKKGAEAKKLADSLSERIVALGNAYVLSRSLDGSKVIGVKELLTAQFKPYVSTQKLSLQGPAAALPNEYLDTFTLVVHEVITNAAKYGALSHPKGQLEISWTTGDDDTMNFTWKETVPDFKKPKSKSGFGTWLIDTSVKQLNGTFERKYTKTGATINLSVRLAVN